MPTILDRIVEAKRREIDAARKVASDVVLELRAGRNAPSRDFTSALRANQEISVIAEVKKASPSAGIIRSDFDPVAIARIYESHGARAISVLTDADFFQGSLASLSAVHEAVACPVLRKDFILDRYQLLEARAAGADAVLLIAECLPEESLVTLHRQAVGLGLHTLIEFHDPRELTRVIDTGAPVIGINNRDLRTFKTRVELTLELLPRIPADRIVVSESGIATNAELVRLGAAGAKAVLVGESLLRAPDIGAALDQLRGVK